MKRKMLKIIKFLIGWPLSFIALFFLWRFFTPQASAIVQHISQANFYVLFLGFAAFQGYFFMRVILWKHILHAKGHDVSLKHTAWYWSIAEINRYIPGNIWSIVGRGATFGKLGISQKTLLLAWVQESILVVIGSFIVGLLSLLFVFHHVLPSFPLENLAYWVSYLAAAFLFFAWVLQTKLRQLSLFPKKMYALLLPTPTAIRLLFLSLISFLLFGLGTYFCISALFYLPLQNIWTFVGLASLSFGVGYVSIITPMGLGVREFVVTEGLLQFVARSFAGFAAIFARFFLIISELLFLAFAYLCYKITSPIITKVLRHIQKYKYEYLLGLSITLYVGYFSTASFLRYTNFFTGRFDLGNMDQTVWNTLHGHVFQLTDPNGTNIMSRLGTHADFILILLAPFYALWEDPRMLLFIQTLMLGLGALFIFLLTKDMFKNKAAALILACAFLLNPALQYTNLYDFHAVTLATTLFLGAWYFIRRKKYWWSVVFLLLAGTTKEEAWLVVGLFGIYLFLIQKKRIIGSTIALVGFTLFYLLIWKFIPLAKGGQHFALSYYADYGSTPTNIVKNILLSPLKLIGTFIEKGRLIYLFELLFPVGFFALFAPQLLIFALPDLGINLLSNNMQLHQITYQYTAIITPFLFIATLFSIQMLRKKLPKVSVFVFASILLCCTLVSAFAYGPLPGAAHPTIDMFTKQEDDRKIIESFLKQIPATYSVAATNNIGSHLSHRQKIFTIPVGIDKADVVVFLLNDQFAQPSLASQKQMAEELKHDKKYKELFQHGDFIAFQKIHP